MTNKAKLIERIENASYAIKEYKASAKLIKKHYNALIDYSNKNGNRLNASAIELEVVEEIAYCNARIMELKTDIKKWKRQLALIEELEKIENEVA